MEIDKQNSTMIAAIMALLISVGGNTIDFSSELEGYYICDVNYETGQFVRLSSTKYSAYPNELDNKGYKRCINDSTKGTWQPLLEFAEANNIDINTLIPKDDEVEVVPEVTIPSIPSSGKSYVCPAGNVGCYEVE